MSGKRILIIDDEATIGQALAGYLSGCGYEVVTACDGEQGLARTQAEHLDALLIDWRLPGVGAAVTALQTTQSQLPVVVISGTGSLTDVVEAMRCGAWDYVPQPVQDMGEVVVVLERALEKARLVAERDRYQRELEELNRSLEAEVARRTEDVRAHNRRLAALNRVSHAISSSLDLDALLNRAVDAAVAAVQADGGLLRLLNPVTGQLLVAATRGLPESYLAFARAIPLGQGLVGQVASSGRPAASRDLASDAWLAHLFEPGGFRSCLCVPLRAGEELALLEPAERAGRGGGFSIVGTLGVATRAERNFDTGEIELLAVIGSQIGVAVARARYAAELEHVNVELRHLDVLREQFIQNVAHELRTPLALVRGYVEMLAQEDLGPDEQKKAAGVAASYVGKLVELVQAITTLQDLSSKPLQIDVVEPGALLKTASQMAAQRALTAGVELRVNCPPDLPPLAGDFTRLVQALHQLLDNACKFSSKGSTVTLAARPAPGGEAVHITVTDQGIGIPAEEQAHIFDRFYQVDGSTTRRYGGTGLGLALAKEIVVRHGGSIAVHSVKGHGSTFTLALPVHTPAS